jgi:hypothetical protein
MKNKTTLGVMLDVSRNAVMNMDNLKNFIKVIAKMGYNCVFMYTEDTYEVDGEPYFGYLRGRYTKEEMREMDAFAKGLGVEMIPCIQTLAHLTPISRWQQYVMDTPDILMVDDEATYSLIDNMFKTLSECFETRRLHVGMDEAHMLGRGKHLDKYGYETVDVIMKRHLSRVCEIAKKYGYDIMIWSDMYFRPWNNGEYFIEKKQMPEEYIKALPDNVIPVYWDYYSDEYSNYDNMFYNHAQLSSKTWFAGGAWTWGGFAPHNTASIKCTPPAIKAAKEYGVNDIFITMWGDNGSECSKYSILPTLFFISEHVKGNTDMELIKKNFEKMFGITFDEFMLLDKPNEVAMPENAAFPVNPCKYMLYSDPFVGFLDSTVKLGEGKKYTEYSAQLKAVAKKTRKYGYLFNNMATLCDILADKYELGVKTRAAYQSGDKAELCRLAKEEYTRTESNLRAFMKGFEKQWMKENKPFGFEVQHQRLGGQLVRIGACKARLLDYVNGKIDSIPELDEKILTFRKDCESIYYNDHARTVSPCPNHPS